MNSINGPLKSCRAEPIRVWFDGTTALLKGQGVCFNWDYGTAATAEVQRTNRVELPTILNARYFAGVASQAYTAVSGGQFIDIYPVGSTCEILSKASNTIGVGLTTCIAGGTYAGYFQYAGFEGEGSAVPLQTINRSSTAGTCIAKLQEGKPSGLIEVLTNGATGGAITCMVGGVTCFLAQTMSADATFTIADGTVSGLKKKFIAVGTQTTSNVVVTVGGTALKIDGSTTLATLTLNTAAEEATLAWDGLWLCTGIVGATAG